MTNDEAVRRESELNAKIEDQRKRITSMLDGYSVACIKGDSLLVESIRDGVLRDLGQMMDDIYAQAVLLRNMGRIT